MIFPCQTLPKWYNKLKDRETPILVSESNNQLPEFYVANNKRGKVSNEETSFWRANNAQFCFNQIIGLEMSNRRIDDSLGKRMASLISVQDRSGNHLCGIGLNIHLQAYNCLKNRLDELVRIMLKKVFPNMNYVVIVVTQERNNTIPKPISVTTIHEQGDCSAIYNEVESDIKMDEANVVEETEIGLNDIEDVKIMICSFLITSELHSTCKGCVQGLGPVITRAAPDW